VIVSTRRRQRGPCRRPADQHVPPVPGLHGQGHRQRGAPIRRWLPAQARAPP